GRLSQRAHKNIASLDRVSQGVSQDGQIPGIRQIRLGGKKAVDSPVHAASGIRSRQTRRGAAKSVCADDQQMVRHGDGVRHVQTNSTPPSMLNTAPVTLWLASLRKYRHAWATSDGMPMPSG